MISENDVIAIAKQYIGDLITTPESHDEQHFFSFPRENLSVNKVLFSRLETNIPAEYERYTEEYALFCGLLDCVPNDDEQLDNSAFAESLYRNYMYILDNCIVEDTLLSESEQAELNTASGYLYSDENEPSEKYRRYIELNEEIYSLRDQLFADQMASAELRDAERLEWEENGKKFLQDKIEFIERKLLIEGEKNTVEAHIRTYETLQRKHPAVLIESLKKRINDLLKGGDTSIDPEDIEHLPVQPSPAFHSIEIWQTVTIPANEIQRVQKQLSDKGINVSRKNHFKQIDLEWCSVYILRNWFDTTFFESSFWTLPNNVRVSLGERPNSGLLPSYVKRIVLGKNISYKVLVDKPKAKPTQPVSPRVSAHASLRMKKFLAGKHKAHLKVPGTHKKAKKKPNVKLLKPMGFTMPFNRAQLVSSKKQSTRKPSHKPAIATAISAPLITSLANKNFVNRQLIAKKHKKLNANKKNIALTNALVKKNLVMAIPRNDNNLKNYLSTRSLNTKMVFAKPTNKEIQIKNIDLNNPLILAFYCKRVPRCPV